MASLKATGVNFVSTLHTDIYPAIDPTKTNLSQPQKIVLITGSGRGIGRSIALRYAECGVACIILCSRTMSEMDEVEGTIKKIDEGVRVRKFECDVTDEMAVGHVAEAVRAQEGRLDVLVNNAGTGDPWVPIADGVADEWWRTWTVNIRGVHLMLRALLPLLVQTAAEKKEGGVVDVLNISSVGAHHLVPGASAYQTSKMALIRLTEFVQVEYGAKGVNCMAVHPGSVLTELSRHGPPGLLEGM